jgi:hypothetical protein
MKILIVVLLVLAGAYFYPQINEDAGSACAATEKRFARSAFDSKDGGSILGAILVSGISNGAIASEAVKAKYPDLPAPVGCAVTYYQMMANPNMAKEAMGN